MGFIDSDGHAREPEAAWDYLDPRERHLRPEKDGSGFWVVDGVRTLPPFSALNMPPDYTELFPKGSVDLSDPTARVKRLDSLSTDAQVMFTSFWLNLDLASAEMEAALMRSWNRRSDGRTADTGGRLLWAAEVPFRLTERAIGEIEFAKEHGAVAIRLSGLRHGVGVADRAYWPLYKKAEDLDLVVAVHTGGDRRKTTRDRSLFLLDAVAPVAGAWYALCSSKLPQEFPAVRWAFLEAGASWLPFVAQEASRADDVGRTDQDWRDSANSRLADNQFYVSCQVVDDLPYLLKVFGATNFMEPTIRTWIRAPILTGSISSPRGAI